MLIGDLAEKVGVNTKTIRYYESIGLLPEPDRTDGGCRLYREEDVDRAAFIRRAQELDLSLDEIIEDALRRQLEDEDFEGPQDDGPSIGADDASCQSDISLEEALYGGVPVEDFEGGWQPLGVVQVLPM